MDPGRRRLTPVVSSRQRRWLVRCATTHRRGGCERVPNRPISTCPQPKLDDLSFGPTQVYWRDRKAIWAFTTAEPGMPTANRPMRRGYPMCTHLPRRDHRKTAPTTPPPAARPGRPPATCLPEYLERGPAWPPPGGSADTGPARLRPR